MGRPRGSKNRPKGLPMEEGAAPRSPENDTPLARIAGKYKGLSGMRSGPERPGIKHKTYEMAALMLNRDADLAHIEELAFAFGLPVNMTGALVRRAKQLYGPLVQEARKITTGLLLEKIEGKLNMALDFLDEVVLSQASAKDLAIIIGILTEKRQLLSGEPTQILSVQERDHLDGLAGAMFAEMRRRGDTMDMVPQDDGSFAPAVRSDHPETNPRMGGRPLPE